MYEYDYDTMVTAPNQDGITAEVQSSAMTNKSFAYSIWQQIDRKLHCLFDFELDITDKAIFDAIVENNL